MASAAWALLVVVLVDFAHGIVMRDESLWVGPSSFAGVRFIGTDASDQRRLTVVGSDDGQAWWSAEGHYEEDDGGKLVLAFETVGVSCPSASSQIERFSAYETH